MQRWLVRPGRSHRAFKPIASFLRENYFDFRGPGSDHNSDNPMALSLEQKLEFFQEDRDLRERFEEELLSVGLEDVLWPERNPRAYSAVFRAKRAGRETVFPLADPRRRVEYAALKLKQLNRTQSIHPAIAFWHLTRFDEEFGVHSAAAARKSASARAPKKGKKKVGRKKASARGRASQAELQKAVSAKISRLKSKLVVSKTVKKARTREQLLEAVLEDLGRLTADFGRLQDQNRALELELEVRQRRVDEKDVERRSIEDLYTENVNLRAGLERETQRAQALEAQLGRLAEQMAAGATIAPESEVLDEYRALRHEFSVISQKYDAVVSQNIELSNQLRRASKAQALEDILNSVRDRINGVLRSGLVQDDELLLQALKGEIAQLQRARIYLGRTLYDVGMVYLRTGDRKRALVELRAARELGVEDSETNRLIKSLS